jgi:hypothetical protein
VRTDRYKWYRFNNEKSVLIGFSPKSKMWFVIQKMFDAIILGLIAVGIYELLPKPKKKVIVRLNPHSQNLQNIR